MNKELTHTINSIIDVEDDKQSVENSTEVTHENVNETESEAEIDTTTDDAETELPEPEENESEQDESTDEVENSAETEEVTESDTSEKTQQATDTESDTSETEPDESETNLNAETTSAETMSEDHEQPNEGDSDTSETEPTVTTPSDDESEESATDTEELSTTEEPAIEAEEEATTMSQESLEEAYDNSMKAFTDGEIVKGTVVDVSRDEVMIDIGFKSEGYIPAAEFDSGEDSMPMVQVGDEIDVYIVRREDSEGQINLSKKIADQTIIWDEIGSAYDSGAPVEGHITERIKGGLRVSVGTLPGFLPASQVEMRPIQNLDQYIGETFQMKVISMNRRRNNIVLSRRAWLETEMAEKKEEVLKTLEVGQLVTGVVKNITTFGAFVDLGGVDGLLHKTDMAWKRIHHPSEIVEMGDEIETQVIAIDIETEKISLGLKQKTSDPWGNVEEKYPIGSRVAGEVVNIVNYGVFVQLEEAVEGLIHVSEMAWTRRNVAPSRIVSKGDEIEAIVLEISKEDKRISLGIKQLQPNPWEILEQKYPVGTKITGRIRNLTNFGAFVEIEDGIDGLIHTSDLSWTDRGTNPQELLKESEEVEVVVLQIDASERRVSLGLKQTQPDPWDEVPEKYKVGSVVRGKIVNLTSFGAFTKLEEGIDGLIHISEIADRRIERPEEVVTVGDELDVKVINLDAKNRRIGLSLKAAQADQERASTPPEERQERPRRQRPAPIREQRQPRPIEEEETIMGALLKQEMGKNNVDNLLNSQTLEETQEDTEIAEETENPDNVDEAESAEDTDTSEDVENTDASDDVESTDTSNDVENTDASEDTESTDASEDAESTDASDDAESTDASDDAESTDASDDTESTDASDDTESTDASDDAENTDASDDAENTDASDDAENTDASEDVESTDASENAEDSVS